MCRNVSTPRPKLPCPWWRSPFSSIPKRRIPMAVLGQGYLPHHRALGNPRPSGRELPCKLPFSAKSLRKQALPSGQIRVFGVVVESDSNPGFSISWDVVPQDWLVLWDCSVFHTLRSLANSGLSAKSATERAHQLIDELEMHGWEPRLCHFVVARYQRIMLAMAWLPLTKAASLDDYPPGPTRLWKWPYDFPAGVGHAWTYTPGIAAPG